MTGPSIAATPARAGTDADSTALWPWLALLALAVALYFFGLGSFYAPTNGDEMVYIHIARLTAEAGHWLPLVSDLGTMRNTKPPLLFWQALGRALHAPGRASQLGVQVLLAWFGWRNWLHSSAHIGSASQKVSGADVR